MSKVIKMDPIAHARAEHKAFESADARLADLNQQLARLTQRRDLAMAAARKVLDAVEETRTEIRRLQTATCRARSARTKALNTLLAKAARAR